MNKNISIIIIAFAALLITIFTVWRVSSETKQMNYTVCTAIDNDTYKILNSNKTIISFHKLLKTHDFRNVSAVFIAPAVVKNDPKSIYDVLKKYKIKVVLLERIRFPDPGELPKYYANLRLVRGHKIPNNEWVKLSDRKRILRFRRAIVERNVKVIFLPEGSSYILTKLNAITKPNKFINSVLIPSFFSNNFLNRIIILFLMLLLTLMVDNTFLLKKFVLLFSGLLLLYLIFSWSGYEERIINIYIIIFVSVLFYKYTENALMQGKTNFYLITLLNLLLGLSIYAIFSSKYYYLYLLRFRGIKLFLLLPILISSVQIIIFLYVKKIAIEKYLGLFVSIFIIALFFLIMRSGNNKLLYFGLEEKIRDFFEIHLLARPRFKDVFGDAILLYALYKIRKYPVFYILIPIGFIGQISLLDTFLHFNHPLMISILQSIYGIIIGVVLGYVFIGIDRLFMRKRE